LLRCVQQSNDIYPWFCSCHGTVFFKVSNRLCGQIMILFRCLENELFCADCSSSYMQMIDDVTYCLHNSINSRPIEICGNLPHVAMKSYLVHKGVFFRSVLTVFQLDVTINVHIQLLNALIGSPRNTIDLKPWFIYIKVTS
jgi:hypothetical protein